MTQWSKSASLKLALLIAIPNVCAAQSSTSSAQERRLEKTYQLGVEEQAYVGQQMLRVEEFVSTTSTTTTIPPAGRLTPTEPFQMKLPPFFSVALAPGDSVQVTGTTERDGRTYRLVALPGPSAQALRFLLDENGAFLGKAVNTSTVNGVRFTYGR